MTIASKIVPERQSRKRANTIRDPNMGKIAQFSNNRSKGNDLSLFFGGGLVVIGVISISIMDYSKLMLATAVILETDVLLHLFTIFVPTIISLMRYLHTALSTSDAKGISY